MKSTMFNFLKIILFICGLSSISFPVFAEGKSCFPIGHAAHDNECYDFDNEIDCLEKKDDFSCGWGVSKEKERVPAADDTRTCETSRCSDQYDDEEE